MRSQRTPKCQLCKSNDALYAMQFVGEDRPSFYRFGYHIRGFKVTKVCEPCKEKAEAEYKCLV